jgi:hypothetical protein
VNIFDEHEQELEQNAKRNENNDRKSIRRNVIAKGRLEFRRLQKSKAVEIHDEEE